MSACVRVPDWVARQRAQGIAPGTQAVFGLYLMLAWPLLNAPSARAEPQPEAVEATERSPADSFSRFSLGLRGFGGGLFSAEERSGGGGGGAVTAFAVVRERWEIELGLSAVAVAHEDPLGVFEIIGKRLFERQGNWAPHLILGPALSIDFGHERKTSAGVVVGGGVTHWFNARWGGVLDGAYRLLIGAEVEHILTLAVGFNVRL